MRGEVLTRREVSQLLQACSRDRSSRRDRGATGIRNAALLAVLYRSGLRIAEALALRPIDVDHGAAEIRVRRGKGGRGRVVPVDAQCIAFVQRWIAVRDTLPAHKRLDPLFCTLRGGALDTAYVRELLPRLAERAALGRRVHAHAFRHTYAAELAREGTPLPAISKLLGHARLDHTATYLASLCSPAELTAIARARPRWQG